MDGYFKGVTSEYLLPKTFPSSAFQSLPFFVVAHRAARGAANLLSLLPSQLSHIILCHHYSFPEVGRRKGDD